MTRSSLIELRAYGLYSQFRGPIRSSVLRADEAPFLEPEENREGTIRQDMPVSRVAGDVADFALLVPLVMDGTTKREFMQNTLFVL